MERRTSNIPDSVLYPECTKCLRIIEMLLCVICIGLAFFIWITGKNLVGAIVILFATSFGFLAVTIIDVMATMKRRQYSAPIWAGLAFLGAFMFFLSFGFMVLQSFLPYILIGVVFALTGIVFLLDGIIIIMYFFQSNLPKKVHPIEKHMKDEATQTEVDEYPEIVPSLPNIIRVAPTYAAPRPPKPNTPMTPPADTGSLVPSEPGRLQRVPSHSAPPSYDVPPDLTLPSTQNLPAAAATRFYPSLDEEIPPVTRNTANVGQQTAEDDTASQPHTQEPPDYHQENIQESLSPSCQAAGPADDHEGSIEEPISPPYEASGRPSGDQQGNTQGSVMPPYQAPDYQERNIPEPMRPPHEADGRSAGDQQSNIPGPRRPSYQAPGSTDYQERNIPEPMRPPNEADGRSAGDQQRNIPGPRRPSYQAPGRPSDDHQGNIQGPVCSPCQAPDYRQGRTREPMSPPYQATGRSAGDQQDNVQGPVRPSYQAPGQLQSHIPPVPVESSYPREMIQGSPRRCQCCAARATQEPKDQVTPFLMHHYNQAPCSCGYTHYQASTVVKGAVKQNPQDTVQHQQRMIKDQLEQMKDSNTYHDCSCHDEPKKKKNSSDVTVVRVPSINEEARNSSSLNSLENQFEDIRRKNTEQGSNAAMDLTSSILEAIANNYARQTGSRRPGINNRIGTVTIGTLELISLPNSSQESDISKRRSLKDKNNQLEPNTRNQLEKSPIRHDNVHAEDGQPENWQPSRGNILYSSENPEDDVNLNEGLSEAPSTDQDRSSNSPNNTQESEDINPQPSRRRPSNSENRGMLDGHEYVRSKNGSTSTTGSIKANNEPPKSSGRMPSSCRAEPPKCQCCPNKKNETRATSTKNNGPDRREKERRNSSDKTLVIRDPTYQPEESKEEPKKKRMEDRYPQRLNPDNEMSSRRKISLDSNDSPNNYSPPLILPRALNPIEEHRSIEETDPSAPERRFGNFPPFCDNFPVNVTRQMTCNCTCICHPQNTPEYIPKDPQKSTFSNPQKYDNAPLNQKPYHPKDEFKLPQNTFSDNSQGTISLEDCFCEKTPKRNSAPTRITSKDIYNDDEPPRMPMESISKTAPPRKDSKECREECADCSSKRRKPPEECLEECATCPIRRARLAREAKLLEEFDEEERSSIPKRSSLKRSHQDDN